MKIEQEVSMVYVYPHDNSVVIAIGDMEGNTSLLLRMTMDEAASLGEQLTNVKSVPVATVVATFSKKT